jgi:hypothetical protein
VEARSIPFVAVHKTWDEIHEHPDPGGPRRELRAEQCLDREREDELVVERRQVVHARDVGGALDVGELLAGLLHAGVQVADDGLGAEHGLALELHHDAQHAVGGRVLGAHVDDHRLVLAELDVDVARVEHGPLGQPQERPLLDRKLGWARLVALAQLLAAFGGFRLEILVGQRGPGASLNCTGTRPTE